jgi:hypothetical protein
MEEWTKSEIGNVMLCKIDKDTRKSFVISYQDFKKILDGGKVFADCLPDDLKKSYKEIAEQNKYGFLPETAIIPPEGQMLILKGDFRKQYEKCSTLEECKEIYNQHEDIQY